MYVVEVRPNGVRTRMSKQGNEITLQKMALIVEDDFPVVFETMVRQPLSPGQYEMRLAFGTDRWGGLEINPFETEFKALK